MHIVFSLFNFKVFSCTVVTRDVCCVTDLLFGFV